MLSESDKKLIRKFALKNAMDYGKANTGSVISKMLHVAPNLKSEIKQLSAAANEIVKEVNKLSKAKLSEEYEQYAGEFEKERERKEEKTSKPKMELEGAITGSFATRYAPGPNGYMHVGNAKALFLASEFAKIYKGKLFLYFDDTNPEKDRKEYVEQMHKDLEWLGARFDDEYYASDGIEKVYEYTRVLIKNGDAYACMCEKEKMNKYRLEGKVCEHRSSSPNENAKIFEGMLKGDYKENEVIIRFKGDMKSANTAMRDPTLLRIKDAPHYRHGTKYRVWPTYDLNTPIMDSIHGVTDVLRSKEYELRDELARSILSKLKLRIPRIHSFSRLVIRDNITHKRDLNKLIKEKIISGWDDPRLVTIAALRRRGIQPEAIKEFTLRSGMSKTDAMLNMDMLLAENRRVVDKTAKRLFFVRDPVQLNVDKIESSIDVKLKLHPTENMGHREYKISSNRFFIDASDAKNLKEKNEVRLKDAFNVRVKKINVNTIDATFIGNGDIDALKIQWVNEGNSMKGRLELIGPLLVDGKFNVDSLRSVNGYVESYANKLRDGDIVNLERIGFFKLDSKKEMRFLSL